MKLEHVDEQWFKNEVRKIFAKHLDLTKYKVFFFGSRVSGKNTQRSDIDIGVEGPEPIAGRAWFNIEEDLENLPILYTIDLVDFARVGERFKQYASRRREFIS